MATQNWVAGTSGDWFTSSDWVSGSVPSSSDDVIIASGGVLIDGNAVANSLALNNTVAKLSGTLTLNTSLTMNGSDLNLLGGTITAQSISGPGANAVDGYGTIIAAVSGFDLGQITARGGTLDVRGSLAGFQGSFDIYQGAALELNGSISRPVSFDQSSGMLILDNPGTFTGSIVNVSQGDTIDLVGVAATAVKYDGTTLSITETNGVTLSLAVSSGLLGAIPVIGSDNNGGTLISWAYHPDNWIGGTSTSWSTPANWSLGAIPDGSNAVQVVASNVVINDTAVAYSLLVQGTLTIDGALSVATSLVPGSQIQLAGGTLASSLITSTEIGSHSLISGYGVVDGAIVGHVNLEAVGGVLQVNGSLAGDQGQLEIGPSATLEIGAADVFPAAGTGTTLQVLFDGNAGTLKLDSPATFSGVIKDLAVSDAIDLVGIDAASVSYGNFGILTINEVDGQQLLYAVSANLTGDSVNAASDGAGGTIVFWTNSVTELFQIIRLATGENPTAAQMSTWEAAFNSGTTITQAAAAFVASDAFGQIFNGGTDVDPNAPVTASVVEAIIEHALGTTATQQHIQDWVATGLSNAQVFADFALGSQYTADIRPDVDAFLAPQQVSQAVSSVAGTTAGEFSNVGVTITVTFTEAVTVIGTPSLQLNDGEVAIYTGGSGGNTLMFTYAIQPGDITADLQVTGLNLSAGTSISDASGNPLSGTVAGDLGIQINNTLDHSLTGIYQIIQLATGHAPTTTQMSTWLTPLEAGTTSLIQAANAFVASDAFGALYNNGVDVNPGSPITASIVEAIIEQALGTVPTPEHVNGWVATGLSIAQVFEDFALGSQYSAATQPAIDAFLAAANSAASHTSIVGASESSIATAHS